MSVHEISKSTHLPNGKCVWFPQPRRAKRSEAGRECGNFEKFFNNPPLVNLYIQSEADNFDIVRKDMRLTLNVFIHHLYKSHFFDICNILQSLYPKIYNIYKSEKKPSDFC